MTDGPPEGWYADPSGEPILRFWDGERWTADTAPLADASEPDDAAPGEVEPIAEGPAPAVPKRVVQATWDTPKKLAFRHGGSTSFLSGDIACYDRTEEGGYLRYIVGSTDRFANAVFIDALDHESRAILDALPERDSPKAVDQALTALASQQARKTTVTPLERHVGSASAEGSIVTIHLGDDRHDLVVGADEMPSIRGDERTDDGLVVELVMPGSKRAVIMEVAPDEVEASLRALALIRANARAASGPAAKQTRWQYKVIRNMTANKLEESLNQLGSQGWELVAIAGLDGVVSLTGNKLYAVLKRQR
ncbi:MAG: DUF2510 domain-containing protein [Actinomycetota bacterium]